MSTTPLTSKTDDSSGFDPVLPSRPVVEIGPEVRKWWALVDLGDIWDYRELLYFLTWRDVSVRYKQTMLGVAWAVLQPLLTMLIFTLFFGRLAGMPSDGIPYPLFAYAGLLPWTFFAGAVTSSGNSLVGSSHLITKVYFPRPIIPAASVCASMVDFAIAFVLLVGLMLYYRVTPTWNLLALPGLVVLLVFFALSMGMWMSALNVKYRDIRYAVPFLIQVWMFASPIIYPVSLVPARWQWLLALNPLTGIIGGFRSALFDKPFDASAIGISAAVSVLAFLYSAHVFRRMEKTFADIV